MMKIHAVVFYGLFLYLRSFEGAPLKGGRGSSLIMNDNANKAKYPAYAIVRYNNEPICGGTIVNFEYVLTAASCVSFDTFQRDGYFSVTVGKFSLKRERKAEQNSSVANVVLHRNGSDTNDLALLRLRRRLFYNNHVQPVTFANETKTLYSLDCYQMSFGLERNEKRRPPNALHEIQTEVITRKKCLKLNQKLLGGKASDIQSNNICSQDVNFDRCASDRGAPLVCFDEEGNSKQSGVLSFGSHGCLDNLNVFMRIPRYLDWIEDVTSKVWKI